MSIVGNALRTFAAYLAPAEPAPPQRQGTTGADWTDPRQVGRLENALKGTGHDPNKANQWGPGRLYNRAERDRLSRNGLARRTADLLPFDATRNGWRVVFQGLEPEDAQTLSARILGEQKSLDARYKIRMALSKARVHGHSILVLGVDDSEEDMGTPLDSSKVRKIHWLKLFTAEEYTLGEISTAESENFGWPETYTIHNFNQSEASGFRGTSTVFTYSKKVHYTRILGPFVHEEGHSYFDEIGQALEEYFAANRSASGFLDTLSTAVFKVRNWVSKVVRSPEAAETRVSLAQRAKNMIGALVVDMDDEDFKWESRNASGVDGLLAAKMVQLSAFTGIPSMLLFGQDPKGFSTGEEITKQHNANVLAMQTDKILEPLTRLVQLQLQALGRGDIDDDRWSIDFEPLQSPDPKELAEIRAIVWASASALAEKQMITREELRESLFGDTTQITPTINLSEEGSATEAAPLLVGQFSSLMELVRSKYPEGVPPAIARAVITAAIPSIGDAAIEIFPDDPEPEEGEEVDELPEDREKWRTADELGEIFGAVTKSSLKRLRASAERTKEEGRLTWIRGQGGKPHYLLSEVEALYAVGGEDLIEGTEDDQAQAVDDAGADDPDGK